MIFNTISSVEVVFAVIDRFGIKSEDFITRSPSWIKACLDELKLRESYVTDVKPIKFNNNRCLLPPFTKTVEWVVIDGHRCDYNESLYLEDSLVSLNRDVVFEGDIFGEGTDIISISHDDEVDVEFASSGMPYFYKISNGWLHTNVRYGTAEIKYSHTQTVLDKDLGLEFPVIPDEFNTKEAIMYFILRTMLMRGYIHPILNLKENNIMTNPDLAYIKYSGLARIHVARPNADSRKKWSYPMATLHGVRKPIYKPIPKVSGTIVNPDTFSQYHGFYAIAQDVFENKVEFVYEENKNILIAIPALEAFSYLYISVPSTKQFSVFNQLSLDVTNEFIEVGQDIAVGYYDNTVYRMVNKFYTGVPFQFSIEIE